MAEIPAGYLHFTGRTSLGFRADVKRAVSKVHPKIISGLARKGFVLAGGPTVFEAIRDLPDGRGRVVRDSPNFRYLQGGSNGDKKFSVVGETFVHPEFKTNSVLSGQDVLTTTTHEIGHNISQMHGRMSADPLFQALMRRDAKKPPTSMKHGILREQVIDRPLHGEPGEELFADLFSEAHGGQPSMFGKYSDIRPGPRQYIDRVKRNLEAGRDPRHGMAEWAKSLGYKGPLVQGGPRLGGKPQAAASGRSLMDMVLGINKSPAAPPTRATVSAEKVGNWTGARRDGTRPRRPTAGIKA
ncbi:MAG: hypothetical protein KI792_13770 [Alphaproteobacteria bacterium]|nr:hypothetical protein [Alphaproteobacteria bacterium SS10]